MGWRSVLAVPVVLLGVLVFWLNAPLPPNTANPIKYKLVAGIIKAHQGICDLQAWWTGEDIRIVKARAMAAAAMANRIPDPDVLSTEENFAGVPVFVYQPKTSQKNRPKTSQKNRPKTSQKDRPGLLFFHGGGFQAGHAVMFEAMLFKFVKQLDLVAVSVNYRLTPTVKAPVPHEDCMKATQHFFQNAEKYGVNPYMIGAAGDSAGGNLATSLSLQLRDLGGDQLLFQLLIYPWVQGLDMQTPSYQRNCPNALNLMTYESLASYLGSFLGVPPKVFPDLMANKHVRSETWDKYKNYFNIDEIPKESIPPYYKSVRPKEINTALADFIKDDLTNPYLFPLLADDLSDLPPAYVLTIENDPIRDEGIWYANRLKRAGNKVMHDHSLDGFHVMIGLQGPPFVFDSAVQATENMIGFVREVLSDFKNKPKTDKVKPADYNADQAEENRKVTVSKPEDAKQKPDAKVVSDSNKAQKQPKPDAQVPAQPPVVQPSSDKKSNKDNSQTKDSRRKQDVPKPLENEKKKDQKQSKEQQPKSEKLNTEGNEKTPTSPSKSSESPKKSSKEQGKKASPSSTESSKSQKKP